MSILYLLIPLGLALVAIGLWAFFWAVANGQFDDLDTPGWSILVDHDSISAGAQERREEPPS